MQLKTLQIVWHGKEPVLSVDFQPNSHTLVSGGQDGEVKHWEVVVEEDGCPGVRFLSSYPVNSKSVNCVRFSPTGDLLASAGDKGEVLLWRFAAFAAGAQQQQHQRGQLDISSGEGAAATNGCAASAATSGIWRQVGLLRGHCDDVLDLAWAPDGSALLSGGIENNCILWDVDGRKSLKWLQDHGHYVQGVAWDPLGRYIATQSADRTARVYSVKPPPQSAAAAAGEGGAKRAGAAASVVTSASLARDGFYAAATLAKGPLPVVPQQQPAAAGAIAAAAGGVTMGGDVQGEMPATTAAAATAAQTTAGTAKQPLFSDDSLPTFFRRLAWSPDGAFLAAPAGVYRAAASAPATSTTHVFSRGDWSSPALSLPCLSKGALVVRFCPQLFRASQQQQQRLTASRLPYRIIMAIASIDSVVLYDMQALEPLAVLGGIHYAAVTDLAWSDDGRYLVVASRDGYCTVCSFEDGELGEPLPLQELPPGVAAAVSHTAARRLQEWTAAASIRSAAGVAVTTAAAGVAAPAVLAEETEGQLPAAPVEVPPSAAMAPHRAHPITVCAAGAGSTQNRVGATTTAGAKRPAEVEAGVAGGGAEGRPKPKRIQPIPLSATVLNAAVPVAASRPTRANDSCSAGAAVAVPAAGNSAAPLPSSPIRRRIMPTRVDGPAGVSHPAPGALACGVPAAAAVAAGLTGPGGGGLSPSTGGSAMAAAVSRTPLTGGVVLPGVAAPGSAIKMPTPQVLVFGTPPSSAPPRDYTGGSFAASAPRCHDAAVVAGQLPQQPHAQPTKPKRVTPVPVDRCNLHILSSAAPVQHPVVGLGLGTKPSGQEQTTVQEPRHTSEPVCQGGEGVSTAATGGQETAGGGASGPVERGISDRKAETTSAVGPASGGTAAAAPASSIGPRLSVAQLAAMCGTAAAQKAARGGIS